jgi:hypothetical protein
MTLPSKNKYEFRAALYTSIGADGQPGSPELRLAAALP